MMKTRPGVTLIEVLVAIMVMGIGLLALLSLFPAGAAKMTQAMTDARCAEAGYNAKNTCNALGIRQDPNVTAALNGNLPAGWNGPSYPVFVDPIGLNYIAMSSPIGSSGPTPTLIPRVAYTQALTGPTALRWCSLADDYSFDTNGSANLPTGVARESRFTWAYMMKRLNMQNPSVVDASVVCYVNRNLQQAGGEAVYAAVASTSPRTLIISYTGDKPNLRRGGWLLDATAHDPVSDQANALKYGPVHGNFYRIVDFTDVNVNQVEIELQTVPFGTVTNVVIMNNVAEVFPIGTGWKP